RQKQQLIKKKTEKLSSNYAENSKPVFSKKEREFVLKEKKIEISIKERKAALK
ncbi:42859_t:CDS:1, partial [Gigaspora margarita]